MSLNINYDFIKESNRLLKTSCSSDIISWTLENFGDNVGITTAFGYSGIVLLHQVIQIAPQLDVYFINTGYHFQETLNLAEQVSQPKISKKQQYDLIGNEPYTNPEQCCKFNKIEPYKTFAFEKKVWLSALRRDQAETRNNINILEYDSYGRIKVHPLCFYTSEQIWQYIR